MLLNDDDTDYDRPDYSRPLSNSVKTLIFIMIGSVLIVFTDLVILDGKRYIWKSETVESPLTGDLSIDAYSLQNRHARYMSDGISIPSELAMAEPPELVFPDPAQLNTIEPAMGTPSYLIEDTYEVPEQETKDISDVISSLEPIVEAPVTEPLVVPDKIQPKQDIRFVAPSVSDVPKVVIIIDDMGVTLRSKLVEVMDGPLTLSYLPYAKDLPERTTRARANGHELMVHMPMEPMNGSLDGGPRVLSSNLTRAEFESTLLWGLSQFQGYVGVNNHMGSRLTQDAEALGRMMKILRKKDVYFVDSKTISTSVAAEVARDNGIAYAKRDVFLDHEISKEFVRNALNKLETIAREKGFAIAIGHPHQETIEVLKEWIPTLDEKGIELVPASEVVMRPVVEDSVAAIR